MPETDILAPLRYFCDLASTELAVTFLEPGSLPEAERHLLVHDRDMTSRLAQYHGATITLDVHEASRAGDYLIRASVLRRQDTNAPVEFGAIRIDLSGFPELARAQILEARVPLGGLLIDFGIPFTSHPSGFFQIGMDAYLHRLLGGELGEKLYGRCNELRHPDGRMIAEVVEILPA